MSLDTLMEYTQKVIDNEECSCLNCLHYKLRNNRMKCKAYLPGKCRQPRKVGSFNSTTAWELKKRARECPAYEEYE